VLVENRAFDAAHLTNKIISIPQYSSGNHNIALKRSLKTRGLLLHHHLGNEGENKGYQHYDKKYD
jgi:hypothetical protein